ncbi:hypothetical protein [Desulfosporosinus sp.]|uniref:hypothetical protein n=1 Tax=Desulfosporosinus sp. TaxID=157907 RepID=UPI0025BB8B07|nr:hypothetical protein [Desulfosporosinus sp.]MBC2724362.1 hypothetical protein [Desulfosporosinus sp.]MBC2726958.1 hypothetical protein [Desulfosporosinus sp.]
MPHERKSAACQWVRSADPPARIPAHAGHASWGRWGREFPPASVMRVRGIRPHTPPCGDGGVMFLSRVRHQAVRESAHDKRLGPLIVSPKQ